LSQLPLTNQLPVAGLIQFVVCALAGDASRYGAVKAIAASNPPHRPRASTVFPPTPTPPIATKQLFNPWS
jgi:hypothetical protein